MLRNIVVRRCVFTQPWSLQGGLTPLIRATVTRQLDVVSLLLDRGANLEAKSKVGRP